MKLFHSTAVCLCSALLLASCQGDISQSALPFPTTLPSADTLDTKYQRLEHDLSPLPAYHFRIQIPTGWKTLDTHINTAPARGELADVAVFRQPGNWMTDPKAPINGEVSVSVVNVSGSTLSPSDWLQQILQKNAAGFQVVNRHSSPSAHGEVPDILITYVADNDTIVSRMMAFRSGDDMFVITGSDTKGEYPQNAEAFNVAISTFRLDSAGKTAQ